MLKGGALTGRAPPQPFQGEGPRGTSHGGKGGGEPPLSRSVGHFFDHRFRRSFNVSWMIGLGKYTWANPMSCWRVRVRAVATMGWLRYFPNRF